MLTEERHQRIIALIEQQGIVKLNELVTALELLNRPFVEI